MLMDLQERFNRLIREKNWWRAGERIVLALSGGVDSVVLFHLLNYLPIADRPEVIVAHVNHHLREASDIEEVFVTSLAKDFSAPIYTYHWMPSDHPKSGIEDAARQMRYTFFKQTMAEQNAPYLLTAHHADDQVETILMRLVRGDTLKPLTGIDEIQAFGVGELVRPLLSFSKQDLYAYADQYQLQFYEDQTNAETTYTRNRFRQLIIPQLESENKRAKKHILQMGKDISDLIETTEYLIEPIKRQIIRQESGQIILDLKKWVELPEFLQRFLLGELLQLVSQQWDISPKRNYIDILKDWVISGKVHSHLEFSGGVIAEKHYEYIYFHRRGNEKRPTKKGREIWQLELGQSLQLSAYEKITLMKYKDYAMVTIDPSMHRETALIKANVSQLPLTVRHRQPGDRMELPRLGGSKKVKDILIDEKIPQKYRDKLWIIVDGTGKIIWLIGVRKADNIFLSADQHQDAKSEDLLLIYEYKKRS